MDNKLNIEIEEYEDTCGDGCCLNYGTIIKINGVELPSHNTQIDIILEQVLTHLGYEVDIKYS